MKSKRFSYLYLLYVHDYDGSSSLLFIYSLFISARLRSSKRPFSSLITKWNIFFLIRKILKWVWGNPIHIA